MSDPTVPPPPPYYSPPPPPSGPASGAPSSNRGIMLVLSYCSLLALIPLLTEKNDAEVQWHAKNGLGLTAADIIVCFGAGIVQLFLHLIHLGCVGCLVGLLFPLLGLAILIVHILCIVKAVNGGRFIIPVVTDYAERLL
jgi:uncharacterized membrane protein